MGNLYSYNKCSSGRNHDIRSRGHPKRYKYGFPLVALANIRTLLDALARAGAGVHALEGQTLLVLALGEGSGLVGTINVVRLRNRISSLCYTVI